MNKPTREGPYWVRNFYHKGELKRTWTFIWVRSPSKTRGWRYSVEGSNRVEDLDIFTSLSGNSLETEFRYVEKPLMKRVPRDLPEGYIR